MTTEEALKILQHGQEFLKMQPFGKYSMAIKLVLDNLSYYKQEVWKLEGKIRRMEIEQQRANNNEVTFRTMMETERRVIAGLKRNYGNAPKTNSNVELAYRLGSLDAMETVVRVLKEHDNKLLEVGKLKNENLWGDEE